ncbi:N-acetylmuramoyl-L-alanine amidase family protein [Sphingobacterium corticibacter]|uniref:N-acetylmuramoyl-L-alanine amidase n=1 Tax=Sphingobacterium corticibacter TaxID=2171749 RepID=A0A2T8HPD0_9SPHI|nr:N-acetylmuramoyl-L-alanine amidase [Sphingobacterium corticibacter]PVH27142.1 N-acetylmuramoyl-L-alanine amidase [Sphingobacterium corticibacter]
MFFTLLSFLLITVFGSFREPSKGTPPQKIKTIVLDAGHGGHDSGAVGAQSREKDVALEITLKLGKKIEREMSGVKVIYTRADDSYPKLYERPALANQNHADLFISIHLNSIGRSSSRSAKGTETFVLGFNSMANQDVAMRENASILLEDNYEENYDGFDPNDPSTYIVFKYLKKMYRDQSIKLASYMQAEYARSGRVNRGVKELPLAVLKTAGMPAVLTEVGFISNSDEERYMLSSQGQQEIVDNIFNAINTYRKNMER